MQEMQEKRMRTMPTINPAWIKEWPALIAKSHKGDTYAFCRLCRCDFSVSSGVSKTYSVTSLIVKICTEHRADLAQDTVAALLSVKVNSRVDPQRFEPSRNELGKVKSATMEYNRLHLHPA